ncbi:TetR/AcrR family transcriptional regulator [Acinetobacter sp.]|uniref:TetR/AcrR family transcriptional regulator n=1 Tax=Acinetobacter sp. TaxID=472 RepID=UPI0033405C8A
MRNKEFEPDEIADAAMQVFWQKGYAATSVQDLVDGTGLSRSSLYNTFENKHTLYQEALKRYQAITTANIQRLTGDASVQERIRQLLLSILDDELKDPQQKGCMVANAALELAAHDQNVAQHVRQNFQRLQQALMQLIVYGQLSGEISSDRNPEALAYFLVNTIQGMRILGKGSDLAERQKILQYVIDITMLSL